MPPKKSVVDKLKWPVLIVLAVLFCSCGTLYYYSTGETKAPGFFSDVADYEVAGMELHFIDVGQGDCTLLLCGEFAVLVDGGEYENGLKIVEYMKDHGVEKLDLMVASHRHQDHIGGLTAVLEQMTVDEILINPQGVSEDVDTFAEQQFLQIAQENEVLLNIAQEDMTYQFSDMQLTVLPLHSESTSENEQSIVMLASYGYTSALLTGDIGTDTEQMLIEKDVLTSCDILKAAHHGSNNSNSAAFLRKVKPSHTVISCGEDNLYGHPGAKALERFEEIGTDVYRTDLMGTVSFTCFAGKTYITLNGKD